MKGKLSGYKTYITAALAILTAWLAYLTGDIEAKEAVAATFAAVTAMTMRHGIAAKTSGGNHLPALLFMCLGAASVGLSSCAFGDGKYGVTYDLNAGVCVGTLDGQWRVCVDPFTRKVTARGTRSGVMVELTFDPQTKTWRASVPGGSGTLVYDPDRGVRTEPALPVAASAK